MRVEEVETRVGPHNGQSKEGPKDDEDLGTRFQ